jgi:hypothetical protein
MNIRFNRLLPAGIAAAAAALSVTQAAQAGPLPPTAPRPVLRLNHPVPGGLIPQAVRAVPLRAPQPRRLCRPEGRRPRRCRAASRAAGAASPGRAGTGPRAELGKRTPIGGSDASLAVSGEPNAGRRCPGQ